MMIEKEITYQELNDTKGQLEDYAKNIERKVEERTRELRETQAKLIEAEKRSIEHRITGGFAHEMRNALSGAQLEFRTAFSFKDKGKTATEILKDCTISILENISKIRDKFEIPKGIIANQLIPELKTIAEIANDLGDQVKGSVINAELV